MLQCPLHRPGHRLRSGVGEGVGEGELESCCPDCCPDCCHSGWMAGAGAGPRRCLCSAQWKLRDKAVAYVAEGLRGGTVPRGQGSDHARELVCALAPLLRELLADKVAAVAVAAMQVRSPPVLAPPSCLLGGRHCTHSAASSTPGRLGYLISERTMWSGRRGSACFRDCAGRIVLSDPVERAWICDGRQSQCKLLQPGVCLLKATARGRPAERHEQW